MDADFRAIEMVAGYGLGVAGERQKIFMQLSALQGSILENKIFEDDLQVESISTAKLFELANSSQIPILTIDKINIDSVLPTLPFDENIKEDIINAVYQYFTISIPQSEILYEDWTGIGYIRENPETGESGWMLSGMIAGGETAITPDEWVNQYIRETLETPYSGEFNNDPMAAAKLIKISATDKQSGTVGQQLKQPFAAFVIDNKGIPVRGASVTFRIIAGGGKIEGAETYTVTTGNDGIAKALLTLGQETSDNPHFLMVNTEDEYATQVGLNIVTASVKSFYGDIPINQPFEAYGKPDVPEKIIKVLGDGNKALVNNPAGSLKARVVDQYNNPVSNQTITFSTEPAVSRNQSAPLPENYRNIKFYKRKECNAPYPMYGDCGTYYDSISARSEYFGVIVDTVLGNTVNTEYTVKVAAQGVLPESFTLFSVGYRENPEQYVAPGLYMGHLTIVTNKGEPVNASKAGTQLPAPLVSELYMYYDDYTTEGSYTCTVNSQETTCWRIKPSGILKIKKITDGTVTFTPVLGEGSVAPTENIQNGLYQTWYTTGPVPELNRIEAEGEATITVPEIFYDTAIEEFAATAQTPPLRTVSLKSGQYVRFDKEFAEPILSITTYKLQYTVYGVDVELTIEPEVIVLNEEGYTTKDTTFRYTILPPEYNAIIADIDFYTIDNNNNESWAGYLLGDKTQDKGTGIFVAGSSFDIDKKYMAQVVLNRGSVVEIRGEKIPLTIVPINFDVYPDEENEVSADDAASYIVAGVFVGRDPVDDLPIPADDGTIIEWFIEGETYGL
jgi:hypothetical protein